MKHSHKAEVSVDSVAEWGKDFESLWDRVGACFFRHDLRGRAKGYERGLLGRNERKNGWQMSVIKNLDIIRYFAASLISR